MVIWVAINLLIKLQNSEEFHNSIVKTENILGDETESIRFDREIQEERYKSSQKRQRISDKLRLIQ